jgi:hypothetical protein
VRAPVPAALVAHSVNLYVRAGTRPVSVTVVKLPFDHEYPVVAMVGVHGGESQYRTDAAYPVMGSTTFAAPLPRPVSAGSDHCSVTVVPSTRIVVNATGADGSPTATKDVELNAPHVVVTGPHASFCALIL